MAGISNKIINRLENRYRYNGIEQNNDLDLNLYETRYRTLDPQLGRFMQIDPETTFHESLYAAMGNNPIKNIDWLGDYFTWANSTVEDTYKRLRQENNSRLLGYTKELAGLNLNSSDKDVQKQIGQLEQLIGRHTDLNVQWNEMENSGVEFYVSSEIPDPNANGDATYSMTEKRINVRLGKQDKSISIMAHELRHGYSYLNGELIGGGNRLSDITDEAVAFQVGYLFMDRSTANLVADGFYGNQFVKNMADYKHLKDISITLNTPAAVYMKYFDDRLSFFMRINKNNANMTVKDAIDAANQFRTSRGEEPEYRYGDLLKK